MRYALTVCLAAAVAALAQPAQQLAFEVVSIRQNNSGSTGGGGGSRGSAIALATAERSASTFWRAE